MQWIHGKAKIKSLQSPCFLSLDALDSKALEALDSNLTLFFYQEQHFGYQWLRVRCFRRLLAGTSRTELFREAVRVLGLDFGSELRVRLQDLGLTGVPIAAPS